MATLYVTEQGARLEKEHRRLLVTREDSVLLAVPIERVGHVVLVGAVGVTTPALHALLDAGVGLSLITRGGRLRGRLERPQGKNLALRHLQYDRSRDAAFVLGLARQMVRGKLQNYRSLALRWRRSQPGTPRAPIERLDDALAGLDAAASLDAVRGLEGAGTRAYFQAFRGVLRITWRSVAARGARHATR